LWHLTIETREIDPGFRWNRMTGDFRRDKHTWQRYGKMRVGTKMTQCLDAGRNWCSGFAPVHMRQKHGKTSSKRIFRIMYQQFSTDAHTTFCPPMKPPVPFLPCEGECDLSDGKWSLEWRSKQHALIAWCFCFAWPY
jgi:hypothetical protein